MNKLNRSILLAIASSLTASAAFAGTTTETFSTAANPSGWSYNGYAGVTTAAGGNPGGFFESLADGFPEDTVGPTLQTDSSIASPFNGNYVTAGVGNLSLDLKYLHTDGPIADENGVTDPGFKLSLQLWSEHGTPFDPTDDDFVFFTGTVIPGSPDQGWQHFSFDVPSTYVGTNGSVPAGWTGATWDSIDDGLRPGVNFQDVLAHVDHVEFRTLTPGFFAIFQGWDIGVDNLSITTVPEPTTAAAVLLASSFLLRRGSRSGT